MLTKCTSALTFSVLAMLLAVGLAACSMDGEVETPRLREATFSMRPETVAVRVGVLAGQLSNLRVVEQVNEETGEVVHSPQLQATLQLKNRSPRHSVRLMSGSVEYLDAAGAPISLAPERTDTSFKFYRLAGDYLDPHKEMTQSLAVPFPAAVLRGTPLSRIRLNVRYLPALYRDESATLPLVLVGG
jgi:hypothetical protein